MTELIQLERKERLMGDHRKLDRQHTALLFIDFQERLFDVMPESPRVKHAIQAKILLRGSSILNLPIILTEQYPRGLGATISALKDNIPHVRAYEKLSLRIRCLFIINFLKSIKNASR